MGPNNEPDIYNEGVTSSSASPYVTAVAPPGAETGCQRAERRAIHWSGSGGGGTTYMPEMMADPVIMAKLEHFGVHSYCGGGGGSAGCADYLLGSAYPDRTFWMTEFNVWCSGL